MKNQNAHKKPWTRHVRKKVEREKGSKKDVEKKSVTFLFFIFLF